MPITFNNFASLLNCKPAGLRVNEGSDLTSIRKVCSVLVGLTGFNLWIFFLFGVFCVGLGVEFSTVFRLNLMSLFVCFEE